MPVYTGFPPICETLSVYDCFLIIGTFPGRPVCLINKSAFNTTRKKLLALKNSTVKLEMVVNGKIPDRIKQKNTFLKRYTL